MHTNLDVAAKGLNTRLANLLKLDNTQLLNKKSFGNEVYGFGVSGNLPNEVSFENFVQDLKSLLKCDKIRYAGKAKPIKRVALCTGSGTEFLDDAMNSHSDVYITGDLKYHTAVDIEENNFLVIDAGHYNTEYIVIDLLEELIVENNHSVKIIKSQAQKDPFKTI